MKDILKDLIGHTYALGFIDFVKVNATNKSTVFTAVSNKDRKVIMKATTHKPYPGLFGEYGMNEINKLKYLLDGDEYQDDSKLEVITDPEKGPRLLRFENKDGDFVNEYCFMSAPMADKKLNGATLVDDAEWDLEVTPTLQSIQRFQFQAGANSEHTTFSTKVDGKNLKFSFGNKGSNNGTFIFSSNLKGKLNSVVSWPVSYVLGIFKIAGANNSKLYISNDEALKITLDSGLALYEYLVIGES